MIGQHLALLDEPLEFKQRLAALVPWTRLHLIRFHGVLAPNAKQQALVVPQCTTTHEESATEVAAADCAVEPVQALPHCISRPRLLKRVFNIDVQRCSNCGGELKIIAAILERPVIEKILVHLRMRPQPPPRAPAPRERSRSERLRAVARPAHRT